MAARRPLSIALMALGVGLGGALASVVFLRLIQTITNLVAFATGAFGWPILVAAAVAGGLAVGLMVYWLAREAKGHGVPEVMSAVALRGGRIRPRVVFVKGIASAITIGTGGSAGREGPIVQIGAALGSAVGQWFRVSTADLRMLVACGAAAGIAATFNAPIGGVFFALEVILGDWNGLSFGLITISSVAGATLAHAMVGDHPALTQLSYTLKTGWELPLYVFLGVFVALGAQLYARVLYATEDFFESRTRTPEWVKPAIGGLCFALLGLAAPVTLGRGEDTVHAILTGGLPPEVQSWGMAAALILLVIALGKIISTSLTIGSGGSGGIFFPGLYIGAALGGSFGTAANDLVPGLALNPGAFALVGMGAFFAGMTHAPITAIVMLFEMTQDYRIILPLMLACVVATGLSYYLKKETIYTLKLARQGIRLNRGKEVSILQSLTAADVMTRHVDVVRADETIADVIAAMQRTNHTGFPVVGADDRLVGMITLSDIRHSPLPGRLERRVAEVMARPVVTARLGIDINEVLRLMTDRGIGRMPVLDADSEGRMVGLITRSNILDAYNTRMVERESLG